MAAPAFRPKLVDRGSDAPPSLLSWRAAEALGHAYFIERGGRILISPYDSSQYDFVVEKNNAFVRVNVKIATLQRGRKSYQISRSQLKSRNPDLYLVWLHLEECFVEIAGDFLAATPSRRITRAHLTELFKGEPL